MCAHKCFRPYHTSQRERPWGYRSPWCANLSFLCRRVPYHRKGTSIPACLPPSSFLLSPCSYIWPIVLTAKSLGVWVLQFCASAPGLDLPQRGSGDNKKISPGLSRTSRRGMQLYQRNVCALGELKGDCCRPSPHDF